MTTPDRTYRERREAKAERLQEWAAKREAKAQELEARNDPFRHDWAFITQPGRIVERDRARTRSDKAWEHTKKAQDFKSRSEGISKQLDRSIYSDDPDAIEALEARIASLEAERDRIKAYNASCRKGARDVSLLDAKQQQELISVLKYAAFQSKNGTFPAYALSNLAGNIKRNRDRLAALKRAEKLTELPPKETTPSADQAEAQPTSCEAYTIATDDETPVIIAQVRKIQL